MEASDAEKEIMRVEFASKVRPRLKYRPKAEKGAAKKGWTTGRGRKNASFAGSIVDFAED